MKKYVIQNGCWNCRWADEQGCDRCGAHLVCAWYFDHMVECGEIPEDLRVAPAGRCDLWEEDPDAV